MDGMVMSVAVGDVDGTAALLVARHPGGSTIEPSTSVDAQRTVFVDQVTIDTLVTSGRLPPPNVVKIDVEGAEPAVLRGMSETLRAHRPRLIVELDAADDVQLDQSYAEVRNQLEEFGYRCERLTDSYTEIS